MFLVIFVMVKVNQINNNIVIFYTLSYTEMNERSYTLVSLIYYIWGSMFFVFVDILFFRKIVLDPNKQKTKKTRFFNVFAYFLYFCFFRKKIKKPNETKTRFKKYLYVFSYFFVFFVFFKNRSRPKQKPKKC